MKKEDLQNTIQLILYLMWKTVFFLKSGRRQRCQLLQLLHNIVLEVLTSDMMQQHTEKKHEEWKGRNKSVPVCRWHDYLHRKSERIYKSLVELISDFSKITGYRKNTQKLIIFLYSSNKYVEAGNKNTPFAIASKKIKCFGIKLSKHT